MTHGGGWLDASEWSSPEPGVADVWLLPLDVRPGDWDLLSPDEHAAARRVRVSAKRDQKAAGRAGLRRILSRYLDEDPEALRLDQGEHGKPFLPDAPSLHFNLSHSADLAMVAVGWDGRVGVDIEKNRELRLMEQVAERFFAAAEFEAWSAWEAHERRPEFFRLWTLKEAYLKAWGTGLTFGSRRFAVERSGEDRHELVSTEMPGDRPGRWSLRDVPAPPGYSAAVCFEPPLESLRRFRS